jgi:hypothetical protein
LNGFIWAKTGVEGGGKTLEMTYWSLRHLNGGGTVRHFPGYFIHKANQPEQKLSIELNPYTYLRQPFDYANQLVDVDEIQNLADSAVSGAVFARLLVRVLAQRRKVKQGVLYTTQNWQWAHNRIRWLTHFLSVCTDLHWTKWGKSEGLGRGEVLQFATFDCKGFVTGRAWELISVKRLLAKKIWPYYETEAFVDIFAGENQLMLKKHREVMDLRSADEIAASMKFSQHMIKNMPSELGGAEPYDINGVRYTEQRENDNFNRGVEAVEKSKLDDIDRLEEAFKHGVDGKTISELSKRLKMEREQT